MLVIRPRAALCYELYRVPRRTASHVPVAPVGRTRRLLPCRFLSRPHVSTVPLNDGLGNIEAETGAPLLACVGRIGLGELPNILSRNSSGTPCP